MEPQPSQKEERKYYRGYSPDVKAAYLALIPACNGNVQQAAKKAGIPYRTLHAWNRGERGVPPEVLEMLPEAKENLAERYSRIAHAGLDLAEDPDRQADTSFESAVRTAAIATDKMLLLRGEATSIHSQLPISLEEKRRRVAEALSIPYEVVEQDIDSEDGDE